MIHDTSLLSDGEDEGEFIDPPTGHIDHWEELRRLGVVLRDIDYEEPPRPCPIQEEDWALRALCGSMHS